MATLDGKKRVCYYYDGEETVLVLCLRVLSGRDLPCCYFFPIGDIGNYYYGQGHPMKPHRIRMTHNLLLNYGLYRKMEIYVRQCKVTNEHQTHSISCCLAFFFYLLMLQRPHAANHDEMTRYHSDDYIRFLKVIRPDNVSEHTKLMQRCKCP